MRSDAGFSGSFADDSDNWDLTSNDVPLATIFNLQ